MDQCTFYPIGRRKWLFGFLQLPYRWVHLPAFLPLLQLHFAGWRDFRSSRWQMNHRHTWLEMTKDWMSWTKETKASSPSWTTNPMQHSWETTSPSQEGFHPRRRNLPENNCQHFIAKSLCWTNHHMQTSRFALPTTRDFWKPWSTGRFCRRWKVVTFLERYQALRLTANGLAPKVPTEIFNGRGSSTEDALPADVLAVPLLCSVLLLFLSPFPEFLSCCVLWPCGTEKVFGNIP